MAQPRSPIHKPDICRAYRAALAAGIKRPRIEVTCPNGTVIAITEENRPDEACKNEWDEVLARDPPAA